MLRVLILVEASREGTALSPTAIRMVSALKQAIAASIPAPVIDSCHTPSATLVQVDVVETDNSNIDLEKFEKWNVNHPSLGVKEIQKYPSPGIIAVEGKMSESKNRCQDLASKDVLICPLTLNTPVMPFQSESVYQACRDVVGLRQRVEQLLKVAVGDGSFWLPVVLTVKGPLYGEVIGLAGESAAKICREDLSLSDSSYYQPVHLSDARRQRLYHLANRLMQLLSAPPATYLVQFGFKDPDICFDRLWPFPAPPALASLGVQQPDLFTCHWCCLAGLPVRDITIIPTNMST